MAIEQSKLSDYRARLLAEFNTAPLESWFVQEMPAAIRNCSVATIERDRWAGTGIPFVKCGRSVRYRKKDILDWLQRQQSVSSTTQAQQLSCG